MIDMLENHEAAAILPDSTFNQTRSFKKLKIIPLILSLFITIS
ncbi:hypothetical protein [Enterococcus avium]|nr:hypothetical protein [Enterococcus avium]